MRQRLKNADPRLVTILLIVFVQFVGASMALPILPLLAKRSFNLEPEAITPLLASFFAAQFLAGPLIGRLSDTYGRTPVLIISQIGTVISFLMLVFAQSIPLLYLSRILDGITGGNIVVAQAYITDITPKERRTQSLGMLFAAFGVGFVIGPALGGVMSSFFGPRAPFLFAALAASVVVYMTWANLDETVTPEQRESNRTAGRSSLSPQEIISNFPLVNVLLIAFVAQLGLGLLQSTFSLYGDDVIFAAYEQQIVDIGIGLLLAMVGVGQLLTQIFLLERLLQRFGEGWLLVIGNLLRAISMMMIAALTGPLLGFPAVIIFAMGSGLLIPSLQTMITNTVDDRYRGWVLGLFQSITSLAIIFSTFFGGGIYNQNPSLPYWIGGGLSLVVLIPAVMLAVWSQRQHKRDATAQMATASTD